MKKIVMLFSAVAAAWTLSGCNAAGTLPSDGTYPPDSGYSSNIKIEHVDYTYSSDPQKSQVLIQNSSESDFDIVDIYSGPLDGPYAHSFPNENPPDYIAPGAQRLFQTSNCQDYLEWWKIKIIDEYGNVAEGKYKRQCGYREILRVTNW